MSQMFCLIVRILSKNYVRSRCCSFSRNGWRYPLNFSTCHDNKLYLGPKLLWPSSNNVYLMGVVEAARAKCLEVLQQTAHVSDVSKRSWKALGMPLLIQFTNQRKSLYASILWPTAKCPARRSMAAGSINSDKTMGLQSSLSRTKFFLICICEFHVIHKIYHQLWWKHWVVISTQ